MAASADNPLRPCAVRSFPRADFPADPRRRPPPVGPHRQGLCSAQQAPSRRIERVVNTPRTGGA